MASEAVLGMGDEEVDRTVARLLTMLAAAALRPAAAAGRPPGCGAAKALEGQ